MRKIMMTLETEKFDLYGHSKFRLEEGIFRSYEDVFQNRERALAMLEANKQTARQVLPSTIFHDKGDGEAMLLVLVFYMGINDGGKKEELRQ